MSMRMENLSYWQKLCFIVKSKEELIILKNSSKKYTFLILKIVNRYARAEYFIWNVLSKIVVKKL